mmetsp:Transcript_10005/g.13360  ORF Transcript_10005/g.13360 Transcript_10005/m.13360 type:complete len:91 (+) Transcript_10005:471-743(+)
MCIQVHVHITPWCMIVEINTNTRYIIPTVCIEVFEKHRRENEQCVSCITQYENIMRDIQKDRRERMTCHEIAKAMHMWHMLKFRMATNRQ